MIKVKLGDHVRASVFYKIGFYEPEMPYEPDMAYGIVQQLETHMVPTDLQLWLQCKTVVAYHVDWFTNEHEFIRTTKVPRICLSRRPFVKDKRSSIQINLEDF